MKGSIFETLIISELMKSRYNSGLESNLYFWRDRSGTEIDLIIEKGNKLMPVEIKSGQTLNQDYLGSLRKWQTISGKTSINPILIYGGDMGTETLGIKTVS